MIGLLNVQRAATGLPAGLVEDPYLSTGCENHDSYMARNGFGHGEDPRKPGYTTAGAAPAYELLSSVESPAWTASSNPWMTAPIHQYLMYLPQHTTAGYSYSHGFACMRLGGARPLPAAPQFYSSPGNSLSGVPFSERAAEGPYTPQQLVGIPAGQTTGPNILLFSRGFGTKLQVVAASLTAPSGPVDIRTVQEDTKTSVGDGSWFAGGGVMIPVAPLTPDTAYHGTVTWRNQAGAQATQNFDFRTAPCEPDYGAAPQTVKDDFCAVAKDAGLERIGRALDDAHRWAGGWTRDVSGGTQGTGAIMEGDTVGYAFAVSGRFWDAYTRLGGAPGPLAYPTGAHVSRGNLNDTGHASTRMTFAGGVITDWTGGTFATLGSILAEWDRSGGDGGPLGRPTSDGSTVTTSTGLTARVSRFENGEIIFNPAVAATFGLTGEIARKYRAVGEIASYLGLPTSGQYAAAGGLRQDFEHGYILYRDAVAKTDLEIAPPVTQPPVTQPPATQPLVSQPSGTQSPLDQSPVTQPLAVVFGLRVSPSTSRAVSSRSRVHHPAGHLGPQVTYSRNVASSVQFALERASSGRRADGSCAKPSRSNRSRPPCTRYVRLTGDFTRSGAAGADRFTLASRPAGSYHLLATPTADGRTGATARASFRIVK